MSEMSEETLFDDEINGDENADVVYALAAAPGCIPGEHGRVFAGCQSGLKHSADGGRTWEDALAHLNLSEPMPVTTLAISPNYAHDGVVIAGVPGGVFRASSGKPFQAALMPSPPPTVSTLAISPNFASDETIFAGTMEDGVFVSREGGARWVAWNFGLLDLNVLCLAISPSFGADETLFAGTDTGIFRSTNGGRAWREIELPFGYDAVISLAVSPRYEQDHTVYAGTEGQGLWASRDEGETWRRLGGDTIVEPVNAILVSAEDGLLAASAGLWHSSDGGETWTNRLPEGDGEEELSTLLAPQGFGPGAKVLAGFTGGNVETIILQ